jgi:hypothetical protein
MPPKHEDSKIPKVKFMSRTESLGLCVFIVSANRYKSFLLLFSLYISNSSPIAGISIFE